MSLHVCTNCDWQGEQDTAGVCPDCDHPTTTPDDPVLDEMRRFINGDPDTMFIGEPTAMPYDIYQQCALRTNPAFQGNCPRCGETLPFRCDRGQAMEKTPRRTMRWVRLCLFAEREAQHVTNVKEQAELLGFAREEQAKARAEGYDDTVQYLQHIIDSVEAMNFQ